MLLIWPTGGSAFSEPNTFIIPLLSLLGGAAGGVFGSYFAKRGEIAAIHSQLDKVVKQNNRITEEAEEIKRQVSGRQRIWELKREAAYDVLKVCATLSMIFSNVQAACMNLTDPEVNDATRTNVRQQLKTTHERYVSRVEELWQLQGITRLLFDDDVIEAVRQISMTASAFMKVSQDPGTLPEDLLKKMALFEQAQRHATISFQSELREEPEIAD